MGAVADPVWIANFAARTGEVVRELDQYIGQCDHLINKIGQVARTGRAAAAVCAEVENALVKLNSGISALHDVRLAVSTSLELQAVLDPTVNESLSAIEGEALQRLRKLQELEDDTNFGFKVPVVRGESSGRPAFDISEEQLLGLRHLHFSWTKIAKLLGVSRWTVQRRCRLFNISELAAAQELDDDALDQIVTETKSNMPGTVGTSVLTGVIRSQGYHVSRCHVYASLCRLDPLGLAMRRHVRIKRRVYWVPGPNSLWHCDTNHKLGRRYGIVVHGGIDGFSRCVVFLQCANNNLAATMSSFFLGAVDAWGWPSRLRTDKGTEVGEIGRLMEQRRGFGRGSHIAGPSTRNQRIERLLVDVRTCVLQSYMDFFYSLEETQLLNIGNPYHLAALHFVFVPRINSALDQFTAAWNEHPLRTSSNKSPNQVFTEGMLRLHGSTYCGVRDIIDDVQTDWEFYGVDEAGLIPAADEDGPVVNEIDQNIITDAQILEAVINTVDPLAECNDFGLEYYVTVRDSFVQMSHA